LRRSVRPHPHASEQVVSLITWRTQAWERRLSLRVDSHSQRSCCFHAGTFVARDNKLAISVQTPFLRFRQCGSCRPQVISFCGRVGRIQLRGLADGGGRWKGKTVEATVAREERMGKARRRLGTCKCAAWSQLAGCILCIWKRARLATGHAALRAYTPRGRESMRHTL